MDVQVKFIRKFGNNQIGSTLMVHPNMKIHLQKIGVIENDTPLKVELKKEVEPIVLKPAEPIKIVEEVTETIEEVKPIEKPKVKAKAKAKKRK